VEAPTVEREAVDEPRIAGWMRKQPEGIRQFVKFAIVGGSSTALDMASYYILWHFFRVIPVTMANAAMGVPGLGALDPQATALAMTSVISSGIIGTANAFYWNRRWTFRAVGHHRGIVQVRRFLTVAYTGMALRAGIVYGITSVFVPAGHQVTGREGLLWNVPAIILVMFWNFFMNRYWTFKKRSSPEIGD